MSAPYLPHLARRFVQTERRLARARDYREILTGRILSALAGTSAPVRAGEYVITPTAHGFTVEQSPRTDPRQLSLFTGPNN